MTTRVIVNGNGKFILDVAANFKTVAYLARFHPEFVKVMKYSHLNGRSGSMGPADRVLVSSGTEFTVK